MSLETNRILLRRWNEQDRIPFRRINADSRVMEFYPGTLSSSESDNIVDRIEKHFDEHRFGLFAVELCASKKFIGFVGLQHVPFKAHFTPSIEIGWRIDADFWNLGFATEAAHAVLRYAERELKLPEVVALTYKGNHRSRRVMDKLGMVYDPNGDFENPHPALVDSWLKPHVLYRRRFASKTESK